MGFHQQGHINGAFRPRRVLTGGLDRFVAGERLSNSGFTGAYPWVIEDDAWTISGGTAVNMATSASSTSVTGKLRQQFMRLEAGQAYTLNVSVTANDLLARLTVAFVGADTNTATQVYSAGPEPGLLTLSGTVGAEPVNEIYLGTLTAGVEVGIVLDYVSLVGS